MRKRNMASLSNWFSQIREKSNAVELDRAKEKRIILALTSFVLAALCLCVAIAIRALVIGNRSAIVYAWAVINSITAANVARVWILVWRDRRRNRDND